MSLDRISEIFDETDESQNDTSKSIEIPQNQDINIKDVSFRYGTKSSEMILKNLNLCIPRGKVTAIVGASGSGKTTFLKLLLMIYTPNFGSISLGQEKLTNYSVREWRKKCGVVMQDGFIFGDTIVRNITESDSEGLIDKQRLSLAVKLSNSEDFIKKLPGGLNARIGANGIQLSGGQKQRILIARAIYKDPDFIFLVEATSALDSKNEKTIVDNLEKFLKNRTTVVVAHRLSTVINADQIVVFENGEIVEKGTHRELIESKGSYFSLISNQLELGE